METRTGSLSDTPPAPRFPRTIKPELFEGQSEAWLAKAVGLNQFGVNHVTLNPGAYSSLRHWHEGEDEFVLVLTGEVVLIDENGEHRLEAGDYAGFPAGAPNAHHLANTSAGPASLLVVGTRKRGEDRIHYPDDGIGPFSVFRDENGVRIPSPQED